MPVIPQSPLIRIKFTAMTKAVVLDKINHMPDALMGIVSDVLDRLMQGYEIGKQSGQEDFNDEELDELDRRYEEMLASPSASIPVEEVIKYMREKHGVLSFIQQKSLVRT